MTDKLSAEQGRRAKNDLARRVHERYQRASEEAAEALVAYFAYPRDVDHEEEDVLLTAANAAEHLAEALRSAFAQYVAYGVEPGATLRSYAVRDDLVTGRCQAISLACCVAGEFDPGPEGTPKEAPHGAPEAA